jgi:hypothetical protein
VKHEDYAAPYRTAGLSTLSSKQKILDALRTLDEDAGIEEAIEYLRFWCPWKRGSPSSMRDIGSTTARSSDGMGGDAGSLVVPQQAVATVGS